MINKARETLQANMETMEWFYFVKNFCKFTE